MGQAQLARPRALAHYLDLLEGAMGAELLARHPTHSSRLIQ